MSTYRLFMHMKRTPLVLGLGLAIGGCGGSGTTETSSTVVESAPLALVAGAPRGGSFLLTVGAGTNGAVTGYCIKDTEARPASNDGCFQTSNVKTLQLETPNRTYYVWTKEASGVVKAQGSVRGPCSAAGYAASDAAYAARGLATVCVSTSLGELVLELESVAAPKTSANFLQYVSEGFYADTVFHRVVSTYGVYGGKWSQGLTEKTATHDPIELEAPSTTQISNLKGTIAMVRLNAPNSATSQFVINVNDNTQADTAFGGLAAFGRVIDGMSTTIEAIRTLAVTSNAVDPNSPVQPPVIQWAYQLR